MAPIDVKFAKDFSAASLQSEADLIPENIALTPEQAAKKKEALDNLFTVFVSDANHDGTITEYEATNFLSDYNPTMDVGSWMTSFEARLKPLREAAQKVAQEDTSPLARTLPLSKTDMAHIESRLKLIAKSNWLEKYNRSIPADGSWRDSDFQAHHGEPLASDNAFYTFTHYNPFYRGVADSLSSDSVADKVALAGGALFTGGVSIGLLGISKMVNSDENPQAIDSRTAIQDYANATRLSLDSAIDKLWTTWHNNPKLGIDALLEKMKEDGFSEDVLYLTDKLKLDDIITELQQSSSEKQGKQLRALALKLHEPEDNHPIPEWVTYTSLAANVVTGNVIGLGLQLATSSFTSVPTFSQTHKDYAAISLLKSIRDDKTEKYSRLLRRQAEEDIKTIVYEQEHEMTRDEAVSWALTLGAEYLLFKGVTSAIRLPALIGGAVGWMGRAVRSEGIVAYGARLAGGAAAETDAAASTLRVVAGKAMGGVNALTKWLGYGAVFLAATDAISPPGKRYGDHEEIKPIEPQANDIGPLNQRVLLNLLYLQTELENK